MSQKALKILGGGILLVSSILFATYYYLLHQGFTPNGEELLTTWEAFYSVNYGEKMTASNLLWCLLQKLPIEWYGLSYTALRVSQSMMYFLIVSAALMLSLKKCSDWKRWYLIFPFAFLMVVLHRGSSDYYGQLWESVHQYPLDNHTLPTLFSLWSLVCIDRYYAKNVVGSRPNKKSLVWFLLLVLCVGIGILNTDLLFCVIFVIPVICIVTHKGWNSMGREKGLRCLQLGIMLILAGLSVLRVVYYTTPFLSKFFVEQTAGYGDWDNFIYGTPNYFRITDLSNQLLKFLAYLSGLFNMDFSGHTILSIFTVQYCVRIILLLIAIWIMSDTLRDWWKKEGKTDYVSIICCLGILLLAFANITTSYNSSRYIVTILPYTTILICRNIDRILERFHKNTRQFKCGIMGFFMMCIFIFVSSPGDLKKQPDFWDEEYERLVALIEENNLGNGVGSLWLAPVLSAVSEGRCMVQSVDDNWSRKEPKLSLLRELKNIELEYHYVIRGEGWLYDIISEAELVQQLGKPDRIYQTEAFTLYWYKEDISKYFGEALQ